MSNIGHELLNVPFPQMVQALGEGVANAQMALDRVSVRIAQMLAGYDVDSKGNATKNEASFIKLQEKGKESYSLLELGFTPTFYQFSESIIELKMAITMKEESEAKASMSSDIKAFGLLSASVSASYSQKYQYSVEGSSYFRTKLVSLPAPAVFEQRLRELTKTKSET